VHVRVPVEPVAPGLHHPDHPGTEGWVADGSGHQLAHDLPADAAEAAEQLTMVEEEDPQHLRDRERPQAVPDLLDDLLGEERAEERTALGRARRTEPPSLTGERDEVLGPALGAAHPREAAVEGAAVEKAVGRVLDTAAPAPPPRSSRPPASPYRPPSGEPPDGRDRGMVPKISCQPVMRSFGGA
jgi:hypothetical protein